MPSGMLPTTLGHPTPEHSPRNRSPRHNTSFRRRGQTTRFRTPVHGNQDIFHLFLPELVQRGRTSIGSNGVQKQANIEIDVDYSTPVRLQSKRLCRNRVVLHLEKGEIIVGTNTIRLHRVFRATPERIYRGFLDADAMTKWLPPNGFTGKVHHMDAKVGGKFKIR